jgi:hypothetical protein
VNQASQALHIVKDEPVSGTLAVDFGPPPIPSKCKVCGVFLLLPVGDPEPLCVPCLRWVMGTCRLLMRRMAWRALGYKARLKRAAKA